MDGGNPIRRIRRRLLSGLLITTVLGFAAKIYQGPGQAWLNYYGAGVFYEIFWILTAFFAWPNRGKIPEIAVGVFSATSLLEFLQLWHPWLLEQIRATFLGRTLIGTTFSWWDFPHYVLGCGIGGLWLRWTCSSFEERTTE